MPWGAAWPQAMGTLTKHGVKQVDRLLSNRGVDVWAFFAYWTPFIVAAPHRSGRCAGLDQLRGRRAGHDRAVDGDWPWARNAPSVTLALLAAAKRAGPVISTICDHIHRHEGAAGVRRILGVLSLARKHVPAVVEDAAAAALELGVPTYRFLKRYLDAGP